ncbi:MAG: hypothetical protein A3H94_00695 [Acidobacteria bacterium RIFCSPLOWO2_02_FULL_60_20]|nr:MAG: hypothetical protein A3H94_00695 [Acidobacteria bacterium RIFCSPLOWO2_02_FULL_60_20]
MSTDFTFGPNPASMEKVGVGLVCSVETFRGCTIQIVQRNSGFNGISTNKNGDVRKIEVKSMATNYKWIAISSLVAIDKLFFERDYWIYFVLLPQNYVIMTKGFPFVKRQLSFTPNDDSLEALQEWMKATRKLGRLTGLKFLPKLQLKFPIGLDEIVKRLTENPDDRVWHDSVIEIWQNRDGWKRLYAAVQEEC